MRKLFQSLLAVGVVLGLAACGDDVSVTGPALAVSGAPTTAISVGATVQLSATQEVTWSSNNNAVATVSSSGLVTAVGAGVASITATNSSNQTASVTITVVAPGVTAISVSPQDKVIAPGETFQATATVTHDPGVAGTVTWSTSSAAVATVSTAGVVTGVAAGSATITATSTADNSFSASVAVTVRNPTPPAVSIQSVTAGGTTFPVNYNNVFGQIDVVVNMDPGDFNVTSLALKIDNTVVQTQNFTAEQVEQYRLAAVYEDVAKAVSQIVFSVNTAKFDATTGVPDFLNGAHSLSAQVTVAGGGSGGAASPSISMTFANTNAFAGTMSVTGGFATATGSVGSGAGLTYSRGGLSFSVIPVLYTSGTTLASGSVAFGGCSAGGPRVATLTAPSGGAAWTATMSNTATASGSNVTAYEFNAAICASGTTATGETFTVTGIDSHGNTALAAASSGTPITGIRLDNVGPGAPTFYGNPNGRQNGWINGTVGLTGLNTSATDNDWMLNGTADIGVGGYNRMLRIGTGTTAANANAATASATPTLPAPTVDNISMCAVGSATDALGNESARPSNGTACTQPALVAGNTGTSAIEFGVDIANPTVAYDVSSLAANARIAAAALGGEFVATVADTGAVGNSGMLAGSPLKANVIRRNAAGTTLPGDCVVGTVSSGVCTQSTTGLTVGLPLVSTNTLAAQAVPAGTGYYTYTSRAFDAAGNFTDIANARVIVYDNTPATATAPSVPVTITGPFSAAAFLNDDLSIRDYYWTVGYGSALIAPAAATIAAAPTVVDAFNAATLSNTNFGVNATINTYFALQNGQGGAPVAFAGADLMNALNLFVRDQTQAAYTGPSTAAVAPTIPASAGVSITNFTGAFALASSNTTVCAGNATCGATPTSTTFSATATGTTAVFNNPFTKVDFYIANAAGTELVLVGSVSAASATLVDNGATRVWTYSLPATAASLYTTIGGVSPADYAGLNVYAFGASPNGPVALVSAAVAQTVNH